MFDVCVVGSANLDLVANAARFPDPGETVTGSAFAEHAGGKGLNQAVAAARSGARVAMVGAVGEDEAASVLRAVFADEDVDTSRVVSVRTATGRALITVDERGENSIVVVPGANALVRLESLPSCRVLLVQLEIPLATVAGAVRIAREMDATVVLNPAPATGVDDEVLAGCDIVVPNEHEIGVLGGARRLVELGVGAVVTTLGTAGIDVTTADGDVHLDAFDVAAVDTTAAGDACCGALAAWLATGADLVAAVRAGAAAGALAATVPGAVPSLPSKAAIHALLERS